MRILVPVAAALSLALLSGCGGQGEADEDGVEESREEQDGDDD